MKLKVFAIAAFSAVSCAALESPPTSVIAPTASQIRDSVGFVQGYIGDSGPYWFLVDTGANRSAFDQRVVSEQRLAMGAPTRVEGTAGTIEAQSTTVPALSIGGATIRDLRPTVSDLSGSLAPVGERIAGIIGFDVLRNYAVLFDIKGSRVALAKRAEALAAIGTATIVPFELDNGIPRVAASIDGLPVRLRIDSGASIGDGPSTFVNITQVDYDRLRTAHPSLKPYSYFTASGTGGDLKVPVVKAHAFTLGKMRVNEPRLIVQPRTGYFARPDAVGFLGLYTLNSRSRVIIDYPRRRLILMPR